MTTENLKRFNHYDFSDNGINDAIQFINWGVVPPGLNARQDAAFQAKYGPHTGFISRVVHGQPQLFYNPNPNFDLEVVRPANTQARIQAVYDNPREGLGLGLSSFYKAVCLRFLNVKKARTDTFLKKEGDYLVVRESHRLVNRPIVASVPNERWAVDLIDLRAFNIPGVNQSRQYIFTCVDFFSGKVWAVPISNRNNNALQPTLSSALNLRLAHDARYSTGRLRIQRRFCRILCS
jgi:hypothetical protein